MFRKILYLLIIAAVAGIVIVAGGHAIAVGGIYLYSSLKARSITAGPAGKTTAPAGDAGDFYTVARGDNPVAIAKKLHVSYEDLLKLNQIEDPRKLQIGQKLRIPASSNP